MKIAAAQIKPDDGNIEANITQHCEWVELAANEGVQLIVFPEMSLTGYQREFAAQCSFLPEDTRLDPLKRLSAERNIIIIAGAPIDAGGQLYIGCFIMQPDGEVNRYTKQFLHGEEALFFVPGHQHNPLISLQEEKISLAICADIAHPEHALQASQRGTTVYIAGIFYTPDGMAQGYSDLRYYAATYGMDILMANYTGRSYHFPAAGLSAAWNSQGELVGSLGESEEGLLIYEKMGELRKIKKSYKEGKTIA